MAVEPIAIAGNNPCCVSFNSQVNPATASPLMGVLAKAVTDGHDEIHLLLNTPGGTVGDGIAIYNFIRALHPQVITYNIGSVNSIGNVVYQAGNRRIASPVSSFMFHGVGFDIKSSRFELKQLRERTDAIQNDQTMIADIMVRHTSLDTDAINKLFLEMAFLRAQEALDRGIADEVRDIHLPPGVANPSACIPRVGRRSRWQSRLQPFDSSLYLQCLKHACSSADSFRAALMSRPYPDTHDVSSYR